MQCSIDAFVLFCVEASRSTASGAQGHLVKAWDGRRERKFLEDYPMPVVTLCPAQPAAVLSGVKCEWLTEGEDERSAFDRLLEQITFEKGRARPK